MTKFDALSTTTGKHSLRPNQAKELVENCPDLQRATLLSLGIATGMRRSDIVRVRVRDVYPDKQKVMYREKKKDDRVRQVWIPRSTATKLRRWLNVRVSDSKYLFPTPQSNKNGHISGRTAYNWLQKELERNGLEERPYHSLRSTCMKLCKAKGWSIEEIAEHVGDTIETVQKHYMTPSDQEMRETATEKEIL